MFRKKVTESSKKKFEIFSGDPKPQGVRKSEKRLRWVDRGARALSNGVKIVDLRSANGHIFEF